MADVPPAPAWSLQRRLRQRLLWALALLWLVGAAIALVGQQRELNDVLDDALEDTAQRALHMPLHADAAQRIGPRGDAAEYDEDEHARLQIYDGDGRLLWRSAEAPVMPLANLARQGVRNEGAWRVSVERLKDGSRVAVAAEKLEDRFEALWHGPLWLLLPLLALLPLAALLVHWVLKRGFRSLEPVREGLAQRRGGDLAPLPLDGLPGELRPLVATLNELLGRVDRLLQAERQFAAASAHELRTPLAAARAQAQRLAQEASDAGLTERAQALVRQLDRLTALATRLLQVARIESGVALKREPVDLAQLARLLADEFTEARPGGRLTIEVDHAGTVPGDVDALGIALRNLIDNALKHGGPQAHVVVGVAERSLSVVDDGPGVAADTLPRLVRPFERGASAAEGSGLGLAMVDTIARQSGARLELRSPRGDGTPGFEATLRFS
jgi:two-component system OmpR family sensor kinase